MSVVERTRGKVQADGRRKLAREDRMSEDRQRSVDTSRKD